VAAGQKTAQLDPANKTLPLNLEILRKKMSGAKRTVLFRHP